MFLSFYMKQKLLRQCLRLCCFLCVAATLQVGPLEIFVSRFNMPDDIAEKGYDASADMWVSDDRCCSLVYCFLSLVEVMCHEFMPYTQSVIFFFFITEK